MFDARPWSMVFVLVATRLAWATPPPIFTDQSYESAKADAATAGKLFIVDAMADWCPPCRQMDRTTWVDEQVVSWIEENAIAAQVDVDRQSLVATVLKIRAMPTIVVFQSDQELGRVVGYRSPAQLLDWLGSVKGVASALDQRVEQVRQEEAAGTIDVSNRLMLARDLAAAGRAKQAADEYAWLWAHMLEHEPSMVGVRVSFMASEMHQLASDPAALAVFTALRDRTAESFKRADAEWEDLGDWITLNEIIGDDDETLQWVDRNMTTEIGRDTLVQYEHLIGPLLIRHGRWADYARVQRDPIDQLHVAHDQIEQLATGATGQLEQAQLEQIKQMQRKQFRRTAGLLHASLLAAGQDDLAWQVASLAIELDDDPETRMLLVSTAIAADEAEIRHRELLDPDVHAGLIARLNRAIEGG